MDNEQIKTIQTKNQFKSRFIGFLQFNIVYVYAILATYSAYLMATSLKGNKKSILIFLLSNMYLHLFVKKSTIMEKLFQNMYKYFKAFEVIEEEPLDDQGCLLPAHPHSIFALGTVIGVNKPNCCLNKCVLLGTSVATEIAPHGIFVKSWGIQSASATNFNNLMKSNKNILFLPGGFEEATLTSDKEYRLFLRNRKGFIKYALENGYKVHPTFIFNENKCFKTSDLFMNFRIMLNRFKLPGTLFWSKYLLYPDPSVQIIVVIGKHIQLPKLEKPTEEQVNYFHNLYIDELIKLFDRHVNKYDPGAKLKIDEFNEKPSL